MRVTNNDESVEQFINLLAWDELDQLECADTPESMDDLLRRMDARREGLDSFSNRRYHDMIGHHQAIQELFDFLELPLGMFDTRLSGWAARYNAAEAGGAPASCSVMQDS